MPNEIIVVFCTCPNRETAERIAQALVERRLAACVSLIPSVVSVYQWQGRLETEQETLMLIKTRNSRYSDLEKAIVSLHPYELPEIIAVPVEQGLDDYLDWVERCTK